MTDARRVWWDGGLVKAQRRRNIVLRLCILEVTRGTVSLGSWHS